MTYSWTPTVLALALLAASAVPLGALLLAGPKRQRLHRAAGWCCCIAGRWSSPACLP